MSERADYQGVELQHLPEDRCRARVKLGRKLGARLHQTYIGVADGPWSPLSELQCAARATIQALERAFGIEQGVLTLMNIKTVESFECPAVIVAVMAHEGPLSQRLVGFCEVTSNPSDAACKAVLNSTNRYLRFRYSSNRPT